MAEQTSLPHETPATPLWFDDLRPGAGGLGFLEKNLRHSLLFSNRASTRLLVTFDNLSNVNDADPGREPWGYKFAQENALSHLGVMAHVSDWYRDADLIGRFETLVRDGFFAGYDRVVFAGVSMGGYAAMAFGGLVEGSHVIAINPQTTLDEDLVPWETRYENGRRQDWTLPLGDAAALTGNMGRLNVFYDPYHALDQAHVDRLSGDNIRIFKCWYSSHKTAVFMRKTGILKPVMTDCIFDDLSDATFYSLYRNRRNLPWYRGAIAAYFEAKGRSDVAERFTQAFRTRLRKKARAAARAAPPEAASSERTPVAASERIKGQPAHSTRIVAPDGAGKAASASAGGAGKRLIVTTMKNEGPFMLEWVAYHRAIGFTDFLIYTNDCDDGTDRIAMRLEEMGLAQHRENQFRPGGSPQRTMLRSAMKEPLYKEAEWLICADCDEFLNIRVGGGQLDDLFAAVGDADAISLCWKLFGNSGHVDYTEDFITERFDRALGEDEYPNFRARGMKTLARNNERFSHLRIHRPAFLLDQGDVKWVDGGGRPMPSEYLDGGWKAHEGFTHDHARLHHYAVRSVESFLVKRDRGRTNHVNDDQGISYWSTMNFNTERDTSIHARLPALRTEFAVLMKDPALAQLHQAACAWHRDKIRNLLEKDGWPEFRDQITRINAAPEFEQS